MKKNKVTGLTGTFSKVKKVGEFDHRVTIKLPSGKTISYTTVWERLPKVGEVVPADVTGVFERLVAVSDRLDKICTTT
jgi:hypothetical protein